MSLFQSLLILLIEPTLLVVSLAFALYLICKLVQAIINKNIFYRKPFFIIMIIVWLAASSYNLYRYRHVLQYYYLYEDNDDTIEVWV